MDLAKGCVGVSESYEVFISYSWDSDDHVSTVLELSNRLRLDGIDCILDQYESSPPEGWPLWMDKKLRDSKYVVTVCTESYYKKVMGEEEPGKGLGVRWEGRLIYQHLYNAESQNHRFIPVVLHSDHRRFVPTPLQGSTIYSLDQPNGYEQLLARLAEAEVVHKPALGRRRLPAKPVLTNPTMYVTSPIDIDLWNKARWSATFFRYHVNMHEPPGLGLAFRDETSARKIFEGWRERYGERDLDEELRISIIEGDVPGEEPGYSVVIMTDPEVFLRRLKQAGRDMETDELILSVNRINRMNPPPGSRNLTLFKEHVRHAKTYYLMPGVISTDGKSVTPIPELSIFKSKIVFRDVKDVALHDLDSVALGTGQVPRPKNRFK